MKTSRQFGIGFMSIIGLTFLTLLMGACSDEPSREEAEDPPSIKEVYQEAFLVGSALNPATFDGRDPNAVAVVGKHFNTITSENVLKAEPINPNPGEFNFEPADRFVEYGEEHDMFIVGHTLLWFRQTPDWFFLDEQGNPLDRDAQIEQMRSHIETVAGRYSGRIHAWDVVNEAVLDDGSRRQTSWLENIGEDYVQLAFEFAREYAPDAELYYNDYNMWIPEKRDGVMRLIRNLQENGVQVDAIGMQGHWNIEKFPKIEQIEASIDSFSSLGVQVMITELDVDVLPWPGPAKHVPITSFDPEIVAGGDPAYDPYQDGLPDHMQRALADRYRELFELFYEKRDKISRVTFWGAHDGLSYKNNQPINGRTNYVMLFDREGQPKPAFFEVIDIP